MSSASQLATLNDIPSELAELAGLLGGLPASQAEPLRLAFHKVVESTKRRRQILGLVQNALGQLRLDMKYLMFDLEATRRERDECRRQLDQSDE